MAEPHSGQSRGPAAPFVVNDLVIREDNCNLSCEYCLTGQSLYKETHSLQEIFNPPRPDSCLPGTELHERLRAVLDAAAPLGIPVVKISGGEVMLVRGIMEFIEGLSASHETVVLLTNGLLLDDRRLERLKELGNVVVQLSLDATRYAGNSYRVTSERLHEALMRRVERIIESGLAVEIYSVLNDRSIASLEETVADLSRYEGRDVSLYPFPVRGPGRERFMPKPEQHAQLRRVIDEAWRYPDLLPSGAYLSRLWRFFEEGGRAFGCHLPRVAFTIFDDGAVTSCPNIWFNHVGNVLKEKPPEVFEHLSDAPFRRLLLSPRPRIDACKACFTPWDPVSLYFEGELSLAELARVPIYRGARTQARLAEARAAYLSERHC